jgi:hypothetical protein
MNKYRLDLSMGENWMPLRNLCRLTEESLHVPRLSSDDFMFMGHLRSMGTGPSIVLYKHWATRTYLLLDACGHAYRLARSGVTVSIQLDSLEISLSRSTTSAPGQGWAG